MVQESMADLAPRPMWRDALISSEGVYRYLLRRRWSDDSVLWIIMLNPSTADGRADDPTIRKCMAIARENGYGGILVANLFAYRATNPDELRRVVDPVGPDDDSVLRGVGGGRVMVAWGAMRRGGGMAKRVGQVLELLAPRELVCVGSTADGSPRHPLYVGRPYDLRSWAPAA